MTRLGRPKLVALVTLAALAFGMILMLNKVSARSRRVAFRTELHPQTDWAACNRNAGRNVASTFTPLSDHAAAALVTPEPETRPDNDKPFAINGVRHAAPNVYVPSAAQLRAFRSSKTSAEEPALKFNPYFRYVDGKDGMKNPTTDDLIQWAAHKWGIPEDWLKAEFVQESYWSMYQLGDEETVSQAQYTAYPFQSRVPGTLNVYQSLGITQERWAPDGSVGVGAEPLRWESEAFNLDYQASVVRFFYDDPDGARSSWGDKTYAPCEKWNSIGGWFNPYPWANAGQAGYIQDVQRDLATRAWRSSSFLSWTPPSLPSGLKLGSGARS
jgi:hypothetical protein